MYKKLGRIQRDRNVYSNIQIFHVLTILFSIQFIIGLVIKLIIIINYNPLSIRSSTFNGLY